MRKLDNRSRLQFHRRPKGADVDKTEGWIKRKMRRKWRLILKRGIHEESN